MTSDPNPVEAELRKLQPAALDEELLARLIASTDGSLASPDPGELRFEALLRERSPMKLHPAFLAELEAIAGTVAFPSDEKIVLFPKSVVRPLPRSRPVWAAAAAVALIGGMSALLVPTHEVPRPLAAKSTSVIGSAKNGDFIPASFNRGVSEVHDEGIIWKSDNQPHSLVRVIYKDQITLTDSTGRTVLVEQPRVEYIMVPAKTD